MPSLSTSARSFSEYKSRLYEALSAAGFNSKGDISTRDLDRATRAQIVLAGNNFFLSLNLQISFPNATIEVENKIYHQNRVQLHSQDVYHPLFSLNANELDAREASNYISSAPNWSQAAGDIDMLVDQIWRVYVDYMDKGVYKGSPWWPSSLTEIQKQILTAVLAKGGLGEVRLVALCELLR